LASLARPLSASLDVPGRSQRRRAAFFAVLLAAAAAAVGAAGSFLAATPGVIVPGVKVAGLDVGGLAPEAARQRLQQRLEGLAEQPLQLYVHGESWIELPAQTGVQPDLDATVAAAYAVGRTGSRLEQLLQRWTALRWGYEVPLRPRVDDAAYRAWLQRLASRVERPPRDARLDVDERGQVVVVPSRAGLRLVESDELPGRLAQAMAEPYARAVRLEVSAVPAAFRTEDALALGVRERLAVYTTRLDPSDANRTANIHIAAQALDGHLLAPGEVFSFNRHVGPRVEAAGFKEAPVIIDGELVPDIGGGVCQVSTTLYGAVLLAGLEVMSRAPHSIPVGYVPMGLDAAVVYGVTDFIFRNDTPGPVLIKASVEGNQLTIALYGTRAKYRGVRLETELVEVAPARVIEVARTDLPKGAQRVVKQGRDGYKVNVWRVAQLPDGRVVRELVSRSTYPSRDRVVWVGAGEV